MLENPSPSIFTFLHVVVSLHVTSFAVTGAFRASFSAETMPLSASALDLDVEIRARVPFKNQIQAIYLQIVLVAHSFQ